MYPVSKALVVTREDMIATANQYIPPINEWTPEVDRTNAVDPTWHSWYKTKKNGGTPPYNVMPYCWSGFDTPSELKSRVEKKSNPVPAGGYGTGQYHYPTTYIAGIDCSGFVIRCWGLTHYGNYQEDLLNYALEIPEENLKKDLKKGDLLRKSGHSILYVSGSFSGTGKCNIYESQADPTTGAKYPGVVRHSRTLSKDEYTPYSIFPQFSDESP
ncbi:MAG: hypothetical protein P8Z50_03165, partial [candidate division WOR-3 bacterium]